MTGSLEIASFEFQGMAELQKALTASPAVMLTAVGGALYREANSIMNESQREVPVHWGTLRASGVVMEPEISGDGVEVVLGYGGAAQSYDIIQHENTTFRHHGSQKDHYLSDPMMDHVQGMDERLSADVAATNVFPGLV